MLTWIREKFGTVVIGGIIGLITLIFVFSGILSPRATRGLHEGAVAGTVNGDSVSLAEFNRELNRRIEIFKSFGGGKISEEQLKGLRIREMVFQELVNRKLMVQESDRLGRMAADEEVKEKIQEIAAFQKDGKFDLETYKKVLESNGYSAGSFEKLVREDLSAQQWDEHFKSRVQVSEEELRREFSLGQEKRRIRYVLLTPENVKKSVGVAPEELKKFLEDPAKLNIAKLKFEEGKDTLFKGQKFDAVRERIAQGILAESQVEEVQRQMGKMAEEILAKVSARHNETDAKLTAELKPLGVEVKSTAWVTRKDPFIPGFGEAKQLIAEAFAEPGTLNPSAGGKVKKFQSANRTLVAWVDGVQKADPAKFAAERDGLVENVIGRKSRELMQGFMKKLIERAKIDPNPSVMGGEG